MQKTIGIITKIDNNNYGNRLQNYATYILLNNNEDFMVKVINSIPQLNNDEDSICKNLLKRIKHIWLKKLKQKSKRILNFEEFNKNMEFTNYIVDKYHFKETNEFNYLILGSDQIWNYNFEIPQLYFGELNNDNQIKISFSASFGVGKIQKELKGMYNERLKKIHYISVREDRGKEIIEEITGRKDVEVLVDPTMILTTEEWDKVSKKPKMLKTNKYILNYFLGELSEKRKKEIERVAKENDCEIINILDKKSPFYECGPSEFLYLEKNAFLICTDSFHSSVFAILYNTPFLVFDREDKNESMNSRIETLLSKFNLEDRKYKEKITSKDLKANYGEAYKILEKEREKSRKFLEKALKQED